MIGRNVFFYILNRLTLFLRNLFPYLQLYLEKTSIVDMLSVRSPDIVHYNYCDDQATRMKVFMAGYSKTGTKSMAEALRILGYEVHDSMEHFRHHKQVLYDLADGKTDAAELRKSYKDVDAVTDYPVIHFYDQFVKAFPEAKVVLTVRDEESWLRSFFNHLDDFESYRPLIWLMVFTPTGRSFFLFFQKWYMYVYGKAPRTPLSSWQVDKDFILNDYRQHNKSVKQKTPKNNLLVFNIREGWEPLCKFLGVQIPDRPFPRKNVKCSIYKDRMKTDESFRRMQLEALVIFLIVMVAVVAFTVLYVL